MTTLADTVGLLRSVPLFEGLSEEDLAALAGRLLCRRVEVEEVLFREGDRADGLYLVASGRVRVEVGDGVVTYLDAGAFFGEIALLDGLPRTATALAQADTTLLVLAQESFDAFVETRPAQARRLLAALATYIRHQLAAHRPLPEGPTGALSARVVVGDGGETLVLGDPQALSWADPALRLFTHWIGVLPGKPRGRIGLARAVAGSVARLGEYHAAGDLDLEGLLVVERDGGPMEGLYDPDGAELREVAAFLRDHVAEVERAHPEVRFIELKAGEASPGPGQPPVALKWSAAELAAGEKRLPGAVPAPVRLEAALAQDARIKADWAVPAVLPGAFPDAYQECSVLYRIAARVGRGQVRVRPSGRPEVPALRRTGLALGREDLAALAEASAAAQRPSLEQIHWSFLSSVLKAKGRDTLKLLKRCRALLAFWDEEADLAELGPFRATREGLAAEIAAIVADPAIREPAMHRAHAELLVTLEARGIAPPTGCAERWCAAAANWLGLGEASVDRIIDALGQRIEAGVTRELAARPELQAYVRFVEARVPLAASPIRERAAFVCLVPDAAALTALAEALERWRPRYRRLRFVHRDDAHLTLGFMGRVPETVPAKALATVAEVGGPWSFQDGGVHLIGRCHQYLAVRYRPSDDQVRAMRRVRFALSALGARPDRHGEQVPHLSIATVDRDDPGCVAEAERFLLEEAAGLLGALTAARIEVWERSDEVRPGERQFRTLVR